MGMINMHKYAGVIVIDAILIVAIVATVTILIA